MHDLPRRLRRQQPRPLQHARHQDHQQAQTLRADGGQVQPGRHRQRRPQAPRLLRRARLLRRQGLRRQTRGLEPRRRPADLRRRRRPPIHRPQHQVRGQPADPDPNADERHDHALRPALQPGVQRRRHEVPPDQVRRDRLHRRQRASPSPVHRQARRRRHPVRDRRERRLPPGRILGEGQRPHARRGLAARGGAVGPRARRNAQHDERRDV